MVMGMFSRMHSLIDGIDRVKRRCAPERPARPSLRETMRTLEGFCEAVGGPSREASQREELSSQIRAIIGYYELAARLQEQTAEAAASEAQISAVCVALRDTKEMIDAIGSGGAGGAGAGNLSVLLVMCRSIREIQEELVFHGIRQASELVFRLAKRSSLAHMRDLSRLLLFVERRTVVNLKIRYLGLRRGVLIKKLPLFYGNLAVMSVGLIEEEVKKFLLAFGMERPEMEDVLLLDGFVFSLFKHEFARFSGDALQALHEGTSRLEVERREHGGWNLFRRAMESYMEKKDVFVRIYAEASAVPTPAPAPPNLPSSELPQQIYDL